MIRRILRMIRRRILELGWLLTDAAARISSVRPVDRKVLVVRLDAIGDFIVWLNAAREIRKLYPKEAYSITLLGNNAWVTLARELGIFDEVWGLDRRKFKQNYVYRFCLQRRVRAAGFSIAIHPTHSREFFYGDAIVRTSSARIRIGALGDTANMHTHHKRVSDRWYTHLVQTGLARQSELGRNTEFVRALGASAKVMLPTLTIGSKPPMGCQLKEYFVIFPGAGWPGRQWPTERFAEVANRIYEQTRWPGVVCGGPGEELLGVEIVNMSHAPMQNLAGLTTLVGLAEVIAGAGIVVCNETSAVHLSAAVRTPAVCILGGGHHGRFMPYQVDEAEGPVPHAVAHEMACFGCNWHCIYDIEEGQPMPCISHITVDLVWDAVSSALAEESERAHTPGA